MNKKAVAAKNDLRLRENFIRDSEQTILRIASKTCNKFITRSDDEWSVALFAFNKAIDSYSEEAGDFLPYSSVVIKRALIDYYRSEKRYANATTPQTVKSLAPCTGTAVKCPKKPTGLRIFGLKYLM